MSTSQRAAEKFGFVVSDEFRESLVSDYREIEVALEGAAWKAVHVLSGSVIEALLVDYLVASDYATRTGIDPLKLDLAKVIEACKAEKVLSQKAADLSTVVRGFRNLIHPARAVRLNESVDENGARVAKTLTDIVIAEVAAVAKRKYGLTAQQVVAKLERDRSATAIIAALLKELPKTELRRLLLQSIPDRYFEQDADEWAPAHLPKILALCFRAAFDAADERIKEEVTLKFVGVLREESEHVVLTYETVFFRGADLQWVEEHVRPMVIEHLFTRAKESPSVPLLGAFAGIGQFLDLEKVSDLVDIGVRAAVVSRDAELRTAGSNLLYGEWITLVSVRDQRFRERLGAWESHFEKRGESEHLERVRALIGELEEPPF